MADDGERGMAFTEEADYDGGQWVNGEFYGAAKRRKRMTADEAIYGVFADGSDASSDGGGARRGGRGGGPERLHKPMAFVTFDSAGGSSRGRFEEERPALGRRGASDDDSDGRRRGGDSSDDDSDGRNVGDAGGSGRDSDHDASDDDASMFPRPGLGGSGARSRGGRQRRQAQHGRRATASDDNDDDDSSAADVGRHGGLGSSGAARKPAAARRGRTPRSRSHSPPAPRAGLGAATIDVDGDDGAEAGRPSGPLKAGAGLTNAAFRGLLRGVHAAAAAVAPPPAVEAAPPAARATGAAPRGDIDGAHGFLARARAAREAAAAAAAAADGGAAPPAPAPMRPAPAVAAAVKPKGFGSFERHTKGFASKYMERFGFTGRLGKDEQGIAAPIAVKVRPDRRGLAYGDFAEAGRSAAAGDGAGAAEPQRRGDGDAGGGRAGEWRGDRSLATAADRDASAEGGGADGARRRRGARRVVYRTAEEVLAAAAAPLPAAAAAGSGPILDMRGPTVRIMSTAAELGDGGDRGGDEDAEGGAAATLGRELLHNVGLLTDLAQASLAGAGAKRRAAEAAASARAADAAGADAAAAAAEAEAEAAEAVHAEAAAIVERVRAGAAAAAAAAARGAHSFAPPLTAAAPAANPAPFPFYGAARLAADAAARRQHAAHDAAAAVAARRRDVRAQQQHRARSTAALAAAADDGDDAAAPLQQRLSAVETATMALDDAADALEALLVGRYARTSAAFGVVRLAPALVKVALTPAASGWLPPINDDDVGEGAAAAPVPGTLGLFLPSDLRVRDEATAQLAAVLRRWVALAGGGAARTGDGGTSSDSDGDRSTRAGAGTAAAAAAARSGVIAAIDGTLLPRLHAAVVGDGWWGFRSPRALLAVLAALAPPPSIAAAAGAAPLVSPTAYRYLLDAGVGAALERRIDAWDPTLDAVPPHVWTLPWAAPHLLGPGAAEARLWPRLRLKFATALAAWHPSDASALVVLSPWMRVWEARDVEALLARTVLPKLIAVLRELPVAAGAGVAPPFSWVAAWDGVLPPRVMAALIEGELLPKWFAALLGWLRRPPAAGGVDLGEVTQWYLGWKAALPPTVAASRRVQALLAAGLDAMSDSLADGGAAPAAAADFARYGVPMPGATSFAAALDAASREAGEPSSGAGGGIASILPATAAAAPPPHSAPSPYYSDPSYPPPAGTGRAAGGGITGSRLSLLAADAAAALAQRRAAASRVAARDGAAAAVAPAAGLSLLEMLEIVATQHGLSLLPHPRRGPVRGEPVYRFGAIDVLISGGVVYADLGSGAGSRGGGAAAPETGQFVPVSVDALIEQATAAGAKKQ